MGWLDQPKFCKQPSQCNVKKDGGVEFLFSIFSYNIGRHEMSKNGTGQHTVGKKSCHVNEINFLSKKFTVEVQTAHHFEAF